MKSIKNSCAYFFGKLFVELIVFTLLFLGGSVLLKHHGKADFFNGVLLGMWSAYFSNVAGKLVQQRREHKLLAEARAKTSMALARIQPIK